MSFEIPFSETRTFQRIGHVVFTDLILEADAQWVNARLVEKRSNLPKYAHKNLAISDIATLKKIIKKRGLAQIAAQLLSAEKIRLQSHLYYDQWSEIEALEQKKVLTPEQEVEKAKHTPRTPLHCFLALSIDHLWGCYFKKYAPSSKELALPTEGSFYLFNFTSHPLDEERAPLVYG